MFACQVFDPETTPDAIDMITKLLEYTPDARLSAAEALCHPYFDELRMPNIDEIVREKTSMVNTLSKLPPLSQAPPLFNFTAEGMSLIAFLDYIVV